MSNSFQPLKSSCSIFILSLLLFSCSKYAEQIEAAKAQLLIYEVTANEFEDYEFTVTEMSDKAVYTAILKSKVVSKSGAEHYPYFDGSSEIAKYRSLQTNAIGQKKFFKVRCSTVNDSLSSYDFFFDGKNHYIDSTSP